MDPGEFDDYPVYGAEEEPVKLTFCLREFKAFLAFCEAPGVQQESVLVFFEAEGLPVLVTAATPSAAHYSARLILATASPDDMPHGGDGRDRAQPPASQSVPAKRKFHDAAAGGGGGGGGFGDEDVPPSQEALEGVDKRSRRRVGR